MSLRAAGWSRIAAVLAVDVAVLIGGVVGLSTIGPSSRDVLADGRVPPALVPGTSSSNGGDLGGDVSSAPVQQVPSDGSAPPTSNAPGRTGSTVKPDKAAPPPPAPASPDGIAATKEGTYESRRVEEGDESGAEEDEDAEAEEELEVVKVTTSRRTDSEVVQMHDEGDDGQEQELRWTRDAAFLVVPQDGEQMQCTKREIRILQFPLEAGKAWGDEIDCTIDSPVGKMNSEIKVDVRVEGSRQTAAIGRSLFVWEIVMVLTSKTTSNGKTSTSTMTMRSLFSPELGYDVRVEEEVKGEGEFSMSYRAVTDLQKFTPA